MCSDVVRFEARQTPGRAGSRPVAMLQTLLSLVAVLLALACPATGGAAETDPKEYLRLKASGTEEYREGRYAAALAQYRAAYRVHADPKVLYNIAQCHRHLGNTEEAISFYRLHLERWSRLHPNQPSPAQPAVDHHLETLEKRLAADEAASGADRETDSPARSPARPGRKTAGAARRSDNSGRSTLWLAGGIATLGLAVGALGLGAAYNVKARDAESKDDQWAHDANVTIGSYVAAGVLAVGSGVCWYLYLTSGASPKGRAGAVLDLPPVVAGVAPLPGGAVVSGVVRF